MQTEDTENENVDDNRNAENAVVEGSDKAVVSVADEKANIKALWRQVIQACIGVVIGTGIMFAVFALCSAFNLKVLWGGLLGMVNAVLYWLLLFISKTTVVKIPYIGRMVVIVGILILGLKLDCFYNWAVIIPLAFTKPLAYVFLIIESREKK